MNKTLLVLLVGIFLMSFASAWTSSEFTRDEIDTIKIGGYINGR